MNQANLHWTRSALYVISLGITVALSLNFAQYYGEFWIPWYAFIVSALEQRFAVDFIELTQVKTETMFQLKLVVKEPINLYGTELPLGGDISAFTLLAHSLQHIIILSAITLATIIFFAIHPWRLIAAFCLAIIALETLDIPLLLLGSVETILLENLAPDRLDSSLQVWWVEFLNNGGRIALSVFFGLVVFEIGKRKPFDQEKSDNSAT